MAAMRPWWIAPFLNRRAGHSDPELARVEGGYLPERAERRMERTAAGGLPFTSALSVPEWAVGGNLGLRPLGQVMGSAVVRVMRQQLPIGWRGGETLCELDVTMRGWALARERARERLAREAEILGADAVVGVTVEHGAGRWGRRTVDVQIVGTAVRLAGARDRDREEPLITSLSVQDQWQLVAAGFTPVGLVGFTASVFVSPARRVRWSRLATAYRNQERPEVTEAFYRAREAAMLEVSDQAERAGADGIVGVSFEESIEEAEYETGYRVRTPRGEPPATRSRPVVRRWSQWQSPQYPGWEPVIERSAVEWVDWPRLEREGTTRRGIRITMHVLGTAIRQGHDTRLFAPEIITPVGGPA